MREHDLGNFPQRREGDGQAHLVRAGGGVQSLNVRVPGQC
jgi:hypothetical protein